MFHLDDAICAGHLNLRACVLSGNPQGQGTGGRSVNLRWEVEEWCTASPVKGTQGRRAHVENIIRRSQVCMADSDTRIVWNILQFADKRKVSQRKMAVTERYDGLVHVRRRPDPPFDSDWLGDMFKNSSSSAVGDIFLPPSELKHASDRKQNDWFSRKTNDCSSRSCSYSVVMPHFHVKALLCNYCLAIGFLSANCILGI